jgi:hypothetical protein
MKTPAESKKIAPSRIYKDLCRTKEHLITGENESDYIPIYMNKSFSYFPVTVLFANEMNIAWWLDNLMQYDFLFHTIPAKNRYTTWGAPPEVTKEQEAVSLYFDCGMNKVKDILPLLTAKQLETIMNYAENLKEINTS